MLKTFLSILFFIYDFLKNRLKGINILSYYIVSMKNLLLEKFLALPEYQALKKQVEQTTFKLLGDYQIIQADQTLCTLPANKMKEQYKNRLFTIHKRIRQGNRISNNDIKIIL